MSLSYYVSQISDNIGETPEGFLICRDVVIARTGWQDYSVSELIPEMLEAVGESASDPRRMIRVYRSPQEVFAPETVASFEGKSITDNHPPDFVDPGNVGDYEYGHMQNVHRGENALPSGDWPLVADLIIKREPLLGDVRHRRKRATSCGYDYRLVRDDAGRIAQVEIRGNHVAVVSRGRAGAEARITDAAEVERQDPAGSGSTGSEGKERKPMKTNWMQRLLGLGLKAVAADASPEELAEAAKAVHEHEKEEPKTEEKPAADRRADDRRADDKRADDRKADDRRADDRKADDKKADDRRADDRRADDSRSRMHAMLDRILDCRADDRHEEDERADDVDLVELRDLLDEFFEEEEREPEHEDGEEEQGEEVEAAEDVDFFTNKYGYQIPIRGSKGYSRAKAGEPRKRRAKDSDFIDSDGRRNVPAEDGMAVLRALRPMIARSKDAKLRDAFNRQVRAIRGNGDDANYGAFATATRQRAADAAVNDTDSRYAELQRGYDERRLGRKENK